jgi:ankyrin repeat protein
MSIAQTVILPCKLLITNGANVNAVDRNNSTPLHLASGSGITEIAEILVENGANVNAVNISGLTPLQAAEMNGAKEIMELLIKHGGHK